jgi:predicted  nucleic acid-binding Zn-ribbon protein
MSQRLRDLKNRLEKLKNKVENLKPSENLSQSQDEVEEIDQDIQHVEEAIKDIEDEAEEDEELSNQKPLMDKFNEYKNDFDIIKNKFNKKKDEVMTAHNQELLMQGKLRGVEKKKAERDMALDQIKQIDEHELIIDGIGNNIKDANTNLANMNVEAKKQRERIDNIGDKVVQMDQTVKKTGDVFDEVEKRVFCRKFMLWLGIVILTLANIILVFLIVAKGFGWPPFKDQVSDPPAPAPPIYNDKAGIDFEGNNNINFEDYLKRNYSFIMIRAGESTSQRPNIINLIKEAKSKGITGGLYWIITNSTEDKAEIEVNEAVKIENEAKDLGLNFGFFFKFEQDSSLVENFGKVNEFCGKINNFDCGISLEKSKYTGYYQERKSNLQNIKKYWVYPDVYDSDFQEDNNVVVWTVVGSESIEGVNYPKIKRK